MKKNKNKRGDRKTKETNAANLNNSQYIQQKGQPERIAHKKKELSCTKTHLQHQNIF